MDKNYEFVFTNKSINKTASKVLSKGEHFESNKKISHTAYHSEVSLPTKKFPGPIKDDLTGYKFGRFVVIGYLGKRKDKTKALWLVRCNCGHYEIRKTKVIKSKKNIDACCDYCNYLEYIKSNGYKENNK